MCKSQGQTHRNRRRLAVFRAHKQGAASAGAPVGHRRPVARPGRVRRVTVREPLTGSALLNMFWIGLRHK